MSEHSFTITLPTELYDHLQHRATAKGRSVEGEIVELVRAAIPKMSTEIEQAISPLPYFSDEQLWNVARSHLPADDAAEMEALHHKRNRQELNDEETRTLAGLLRRYDRFMLLRAEAAALLKQRGHDVSVLLKAS